MYIKNQMYHEYYSYLTDIIFSDLDDFIHCKILTFDEFVNFMELNSTIVK